MSILSAHVLFDVAIMIHVIVFIHCLQLMKMTEENESEGDTLRANHAGTNNITTNKVTFLPSVTHMYTHTHLQGSTVTTQTVTIHTTTRNTCPVQTAKSNISATETAADADALTQGYHRSLEVCFCEYSCKIDVSLK